MLLRVGQPDRIQWKTFLRIAVPLAAVVGVSPAVHPLLALLLLPGSVIFALHVYRRKQTGPLRPFQGAKLGAFIGLASFGFYTVLFAIQVAGDPGGFRRDMASVIQQAIARNPTPEARQMAEAILSGTGGLVLFSALEMGFLLAFLLAIGSASGALAARFSREKAP
jgi:hypothetical protein